jgi:hypothetical protein
MNKQNQSLLAYALPLGVCMVIAGAYASISAPEQGIPGVIWALALIAAFGILAACRRNQWE